MNCYVVLAGIAPVAVVIAACILWIWRRYAAVRGEIMDPREERIPFDEALEEEFARAETEGREPDINKLTDLLLEGFRKQAIERRARQARLVGRSEAMKKLPKP